MKRIARDGSLTPGTVTAYSARDGLDLAALRARRWYPPTTRVDAVRVPPVVMRAALDLAGGDAGRIEIREDLTVIVHNTRAARDRARR